MSRPDGSAPAPPHSLLPSCVRSHLAVGSAPARRRGSATEDDAQIAPPGSCPGDQICPRVYWPTDPLSMRVACLGSQVERDRLRRRAHDRSRSAGEWRRWRAGPGLVGRKGCRRAVSGDYRPGLPSLPCGPPGSVAACGKFCGGWAGRTASAAAGRRPGRYREGLVRAAGAAGSQAAGIRRAGPGAPRRLPRRKPPRPIAPRSPPSRSSRPGRPALPPGLSLLVPQSPLPGFHLGP